MFCLQCSGLNSTPTELLQDYMPTKVSGTEQCHRLFRVCHFPSSLEPLTDRSNKNQVHLHHLTLWLNTVTFTSLHHGTGLVEKSGQSVVDGALFGDLQGHHRARPRHQLCRPAGTRTDSE